MAKQTAVSAPANDENDVPKMQQSEFEELRDQVNGLGMQDHRLGKVLMDMLHHLAHAHGLDTTVATEQPTTQEENEDAG